MSREPLVAPEGFETVFDDREVEEPVVSEHVLVEGRNGKMREQTDVEWAKDYIKEYGEEEYVKFLLEERVENPRGVKIKNKELARKLIDEGLQK